MTAAEIDFLDPDLFLGDIPFAAFRELRDDAPVQWRERPGERGYWYVTRHDDVCQVMRDAASYSSYREGTGLNDPDEDLLQTLRLLFINMDPPDHTRYRKLVNKSFAVRAVDHMVPRLKEIAATLIDRVADRGSCDFMAEIGGKLPMQIVCELVGVPEADRDRLYLCSNKVLGVDDPEVASSPEESAAALMEIYGYGAMLAEERRSSPRQDLMTALIAAEVDGEKLTEAEISAFFLLLVAAGNEATRNLLGGGLVLLFEHPEARARLAANPLLWPGAIEEMLRVVSPLLQWRRTLTRDVTLRGQELRAGEKVIVCLISANNDERVFADPQRFDIERHPNPHLGFGYGPHLCIGATLARMEARALFEELLRRLPDVEQAGPASRLRSNYVHGLKKVPIRYTPTR